MNGVTDDDWNDMTFVVNNGQTEASQAHFENACLRSVFVPQRLICLQMAIEAVAPAAIAGASDVVKIKPGA